MTPPRSRLRPLAVHGWVDGILSLGSLALLVTGAVLVGRAEYLAGVAGLVAGVFGFALVEVLSILHQLYRRLAEIEVSTRERVAEAEARLLARLTGTPGGGPSDRGPPEAAGAPGPTV